MVSSRLRLVCGSLFALGILGIPSANADPHPSGPPISGILQSGSTLGSHKHGTGDVNKGKRDAKKLAVFAEFLLTADEGDHHIESIGVDVNKWSSHNFLDTVVTFHNMQDDRCGEAGDPGSALNSLCTPTYHFGFQYRVGLYQLPFAQFSQPDYKQFFENVSSCKGTCTKAIKAAPAGYQFVLTGFKVTYAKENKYVRRLSVLPHSAPKTMTVRFHDNGTPDFSAEVSGLYLANKYIKVANKQVTLEYKPGKPAPKFEVGYDPYAITGFDFEFLNGDHKLGSIGFKNERPYLVPKLRDKNNDDPWKVTIKYAVLKL